MLRSVVSAISVESISHRRILLLLFVVVIVSPFWFAWPGLDSAHSVMAMMENLQTACRTEPHVATPPPPPPDEEMVVHPPEQDVSSSITDEPTVVPSETHHTNGTQLPINRTLLRTNRTRLRTGPTKCRVTWHTRWNSRSAWHVDRNVNARVGCPRRQSITCEGERLKRALVIYMLHTRSDAKTMHPEMYNFNYFQDFALFGPDDATEVFSGVDYVFARMKPVGEPIISKPTLCGERRNVKLLWVPGGPCDLCAHHRVIEYLGGAEAVASHYGYLVFLNAAVRGPFQHANDPAWLDVLFMAGHDVWTPQSHPILVGPTVSSYPAVHVQSYMVGVPMSILRTVDQKLNVCSGDKDFCIVHGEVAIGRAVLNVGGWLHALTRNLSVRSFVDVEPYRLLHESFNPNVGEPMFTVVDACAAVMVKHGGEFLKTVPETVQAQLAQLTVLQPRSRRLNGHSAIRDIMRDTAECRFLLL